MGDKTRARAKMMAAGVPVVPGDNGPGGRGFPSAEAALESAKKIGFPVMLKASAGGGGKGMRLVDDDKKFVAAYQGAQRDLVRLQIAVANGEKLPFKQEDLKVHGAAIECRIYAEDPIKFLPSPGKIVQYRQPTGPYVRDDSGVYEGAEISVFYDPMISKLITWGATRAEAIERMERALKEYRVGGIKTNLAFHRRVLREPDFRAGKYSTAYIEAHKELLAKPYGLDDDEAVLDAALAAAALHALDAAPQPTAGNGHAVAAAPSPSVERTGWQRSLGFTGG